MRIVNANIELETQQNFYKRKIMISHINRGAYISHSIYLSRWQEGCKHQPF